MTKLFKNRLLALMAAVLMVGVLAGCGGKTETPAPAPAAPVAAAPAPAPAPVDKGAIIKAAAISYFDSLPSDSNNIKAPDVQKLIDNKTDFFGVDIRGPEDYAKGHLPGFVNIPFATMGQNLDKLPKDKLIVVQCYTGQTASQTTGVLRMLGYNAKNLHFGFKGVTDNALLLVQ